MSKSVFLNIVSAISIFFHRDIIITRPKDIIREKNNNEDPFYGQTSARLNGLVKKLSSLRKKFQLSNVSDETTNCVLRKHQLSPHLCMKPWLGFFSGTGS